MIEKVELKQYEWKKKKPGLGNTLQRHHDYYVRLRAEGKLTEKDRPQYELAMQREARGLVQPHKEEKE